MIGGWKREFKAKYGGDSKKLTGTFEELLKNFNLTYINTFGNLYLLLTQKGLILKKMFFMNL